MAVVERDIGTSPEQVFAVLANGWYYSGWVVGTSHMRAVENHWPSAGSRLFHASGIWPAALADETEVLEMVPNQRLVMTARVRPFGEARIELTLTRDGDHTVMQMTETAVSGPGRWIHSPLTERLLVRRNVESLARLAAIAERRTGP